MNRSALIPRPWSSLGVLLLPGLLAPQAAAAPASPPTPPPAPAATAPWNAQAPVPPLQVPRPFARYRSAAETPVADWPEANRTVQRIGGWRAYAREAAAPPPSPAPTSAPSNGTPQPVPRPQ